MALKEGVNTSNLKKVKYLFISSSIELYFAIMTSHSTFFKFA
jgi:hypothetical protein